jgi:bifunctional DNase/RNase
VDAGGARHALIPAGVAGGGAGCYDLPVVVVHLVTITLDPRDAHAVVVLQDARGRTLPLWVDDAAATAIAAAARGTRDTTSAPALLVAGLEATGGAIVHVELRALQGGVLQAVVVVAGALGVVELPTRASHAVAAALVQGCPIVADDAVIAWTHQRVVEAAARAQPAGEARAGAVDEPLSQSTAERWNALLQHLADKLHDERPS